MKKKTAAIVACIIAAAFEINAFADVLGNVIDGYSTYMYGKTTFYHNVYQNDSTYQREYYVDYKPNSGVVPIVVNGDKIYGKRTITQTIDYMQKNGMKPLIGINADYFSFQTGIPMGHTISGGEILTSDTTGQNAIGFNADGSAFISWLQIQSKFIKENGGEMQLDCINKWCQPTISASYLLTDMFSSSTKTSGSCKFVIFSKVSGSLSIGGEIKLRVDERFDYDGEIAIPEDKYVLVMTNTYGEPDKLSFMDSLSEGDVVTLRSDAVYDAELWSKADSGMGSIGGRLIENGTVNTNFEAGTAPRTAVGIKADGSVVFYVIDGRQKGYSTGVQIKTLAKRMEELGCVNAINLDGGGSTAIAGIFPGSSEYAVINSPSEGSLRKCANYIFLKDQRVATGIADSFKFDITDNRNFLSGYTESIKLTELRDTAELPMDMSGVTYTAENSDSAYVTLDGTNARVGGSGTAVVKASANGGSYDISYDIYETPDEIKAYSGGAPVDSINASSGSAVDLDAQSYVNGVLLNSDDACYSYSCDENIGTIDDRGVFTAGEKTASGNIYIRAGEKTLSLPANVTEKAIFADTENHWAREYADKLYKENILKGEQGENGVYYRPDSFITRGELAAVIARYLKLDTSAYGEYEFADYGKTADWVKPYINAVAAEGIMNGKLSGGKKYFAPNDLLTRAEAIAVIGRISKESETDFKAEFTDMSDVPDYALEYVNLLAGLKIIGGYSDGSLRPYGNITRGECAKIICLRMETSN